MENGHDFVDYYALLQVDSTCDSKMLEKAYRHFAQLYHPDHPESADVGKFQEIISAYKVLRDPQSRKQYDKAYRERRKSNFFEFAQNEDVQISEESALKDAEAHQTILYFLYKRRREHADEPGVIGYFLQELLDCSDESFEFHTWYLKSKGYIEALEDGTLAITIEGVDHVISMSRASEAEKLLISQSQVEVPEPREAG